MQAYGMASLKQCSRIAPDLQVVLQFRNLKAVEGSLPCRNLRCRHHLDILCKQAVDRVSLKQMGPGSMQSGSLRSWNALTRLHSG